LRAIDRKNYSGWELLGRDFGRKVGKVKNFNSHYRLKGFGIGRFLDLGT